MTAAEKATLTETEIAGIEREMQQRGRELREQFSCSLVMRLHDGSLVVRGYERAGCAFNYANRRWLQIERALIQTLDDDYWRWNQAGGWCGGFA